MNKIPWILTAMVFCLSCQTIEMTEKKYPCQSLDWFEIGRSHGVQGLDSMQYQIRKDTCEGFSDNHHQSYVNGWYGGVDEFCSPMQGFAYGRSGQDYRNVCPRGKEKPFLEAYRKGMKVFLYEKDNQQISEELQVVTTKAAASEPQQIPELLQRMTELETRLELNRALISEIQSEMDETQSQTF